MMIKLNESLLKWTWVCRLPFPLWVLCFTAWAYDERAAGSGKLRMWRMRKAELLNRQMLLLNTHHVHQLDYCMPLVGDGCLILLLQLLIAFKLFKHL
jgi:hypothetical protein